MAIHWQIPFVSLRSGTQYTVNVYDADYTGTPIVLKGGAEPFTTEEDGDDDPFTPIRTQSGKLRIVDDGYAADGVTPFDWKAFVPATAADRPVTLTHVSNSQTIVDWQGFIQTQDFSGTLYGNPQEREFPVFCPLSILETKNPSADSMQLYNFAYIIELAASTAESLSGNVVGFDTIVVQGNQDAQQWLQKKLDWMNVMKESNDDNIDIEPQYNIFEILEDACKFWGWTCRSQARTLYLTCYDDLSEPKWVSMTRAELQTMVSGTQAGTNDVEFVSTTLTGDIFASTENDDFKRRGPGKAIVKADCNHQDTVVKFAPKSVEQELGDTYSWVSGGEDLVGYFTTLVKSSFGQNATDPSYNVMSGTGSTGGGFYSYGGFCRRQIFSSTEQDKATKCDLILIHRFDPHHEESSPCSQIVIKNKRNYSGGSLSLKGNLFNGAKQFEAGEDMFAFFRIGIGGTYNSALWFKLTCDTDGHIIHGWESTPQMLAVRVNGSSLGGFNAFNLGTYPMFASDIEWGNFSQIPIDEGLSGNMFIDFMGCHRLHSPVDYPAEIADFEVVFTRDTTEIINNTDQHRPRIMSEERVSSREYTATNNNASGEDWNADCIYASDNNMEYGYGLVINPEGTFMETARYGHDIEGTGHDSMEHPEQHLANRVAAYWATSRRQITTELRTDAITAITPRHKITIDGNLFHPTAISHTWSEDVTTLILLESRTE